MIAAGEFGGQRGQADGCFRLAAKVRAHDVDHPFHHLQDPFSIPLR